MIAKADDFFPTIGQIGFQIRRVRAVTRVGLKEFVPEHDAIFVAEIIEVIARAWPTQLRIIV